MITFVELLKTFSLLLLPLLIIVIICYGLAKRVPVYEAFVEGAKDGVKTGLNIIPYLVAIIAAVSMFRASGLLDLTAVKLAPVLNFCHIPPDILPVMFTRSLSGSATLGLLSEIISATGVDSYASTLAAVMIGSSETTFYVLAVYFGSVGIKKFRHALLAGLIADFAGILAAVFVSYLVF